MRDIVYIGDFDAGSCFLIKGTVNVIVDPGMAWCAGRTIERVLDEIGDSSVGAILLTHSHYDHVGALPYFRRQWPEAVVYSGRRAMDILIRPSARELMLRLSRDAAEINDSCIPEDYDPQLLYADKAAVNGETVYIGDMKISFLETPGHTKDSVSYFIDDSILMSSETIGLFNCDGSYAPEFLVGYGLSLKSISDSRALKPARLCLPHNGIFDSPGDDFWDDFEKSLRKCGDSIQTILIECRDEDERLLRMEQLYWHPERENGWPKAAFDVNAQAMLRTIERELLTEPHGC